MSLKIDLFNLGMNSLKPQETKSLQSHFYGPITPFDHNQGDQIVA